GRLRQELADIARAIGKPADRAVFLRRERGVREQTLQLPEDAGEKRLRRRPRIGGAAGAVGAAGGAARAAARVDEAVGDLIFVEGLRGSARDMNLRSRFFLCSSPPLLRGRTLRRGHPPPFIPA